MDIAKRGWGTGLGWKTASEARRELLTQTTLAQKSVRKSSIIKIRLQSHIPPLLLSLVAACSNYLTL